VSGAAFLQRPVHERLLAILKGSTKLFADETTAASVLPLRSEARSSALGDADDPYGGMGRNGARRTPEADGRDFTLTKVGQSWTLDNGKVHNFESSACIAGHGGVANAAVAYLTLAAAARP